MGQKRSQFLFLKIILGYLLKTLPFHTVPQSNGSLCLKLWKAMDHLWKFEKLPKTKPTKQQLFTFLETDTRSREMFFLTNEVKRASSLPQHCPNLNSLKDASWNSENPVANYMNITSCNKNLTCFISVFVIPAFRQKKITVPNSNIKPCVTSH